MNTSRIDAYRDTINDHLEAAFRTWQAMKQEEWQHRVDRTRVQFIAEQLPFMELRDRLTDSPSV